MAKLDPCIQRLFTQRATEVMFLSGATPVLRTASGVTKLLRQPLETPQIVAAFAEIVPPESRDRFPVEGSTRWVYESPAGAVQVHVHRHQQRVSVTIRPAGAEVPVEAPAGGPAPTPEPKADGPAMPIPLRPRPKAEGGPVEAEPAAATPAEVDPGPALRILRLPEPPRAVHGDPAAAMAQLLDRMVDRKASDLHLVSETVPMFRIDGDMGPDPEWRPIGREQLQAMLFSITPERNRHEWEERSDTDFAYETPVGRFRVNLFADRKGIGAVLRHIPNTIRTPKELGLSDAILELCTLQKGLVLVTGPTGSGKSTTLAAMIDHVNATRTDHIITIEDPVEFVHSNRRCLVNQREVGVHTGSFKQALRAALREDPDVILVGELRDLETVSIALETAETGHLVFGTLHTNTAPSTVDRIIDQFPADRQSQVRTMLSESLRGVVTQTLCKKIGGGRVAAHEVLLSNSAVANLIREGKTFQLASALQTGRGQGMTTMNDALFDLVKKNLVEPRHALERAVNRAELRSALERAGYKLNPGEPARAAVA